MREMIKQLPEIIRAAATSNLGIIALMVILLSALAYAFFRKSREGWRLAALSLLFVGCFAFGFAVLRVGRPPGSTRVTLASATPLDADLGGLGVATHRWIEASERAREAKTIATGRALPNDLIAARNEFENAWSNASLADKKRLLPEQVSKALSNLNRLYRLIEADSSTQPTANSWADEAIRFFEEIQHRKFLTEALLDKAAIYLDLAQLGNNDKEQFERMAREGDAVMTHAFRAADSEQRPIVLRISSRFYYNLSRPKTFRLSEEWDNNYLLLAYQKAKEAYDLGPSDIKSANELARTVIKASKNPPQDGDPVWVTRLRESQEQLKKAWTQDESKLLGLNQRLSPLDVLGVSTLETVAREWSDLELEARRRAAAGYLEELETDALAPLREAAALLQNSELRKSYGFDIYYDIARAHAVKTAILRALDGTRADKEFVELKSNLAIAKENAKTSQLEAAVKDVHKEIAFVLLTPDERSDLAKLLSVGTI